MAATFAAMIIVGCGADDLSDVDDGASTTAVDGPRVADPRFEGRFVITEVDVGNDIETFDLMPVIAIETVFGGLTVEPGCNTHFGSFTLDDDGTASFTVAGDTGRDCGELAAQETLVIDTLTSVESWAEGPDGFRLDGPAGSLVIERP